MSSNNIEIFDIQKAIQKEQILNKMKINQFIARSNRSVKEKWNT